MLSGSGCVAAVSGNRLGNDCAELGRKRDVATGSGSPVIAGAVRSRTADRIRFGAFAVAAFTGCAGISCYAAAVSK